jgi:hypothetical protein
VTLRFDNGYSRWNGKEVAVKYGVVDKSITSQERQYKEENAEAEDVPV